MNNKNKLLQNGAMTAGREGQESERYNPASLVHSPEVRGQNHQYVGRVGFLCGGCVRPYRSAAPTTALRSRSPPGRSCCVWIASAAPWLQQTHNKL